VAAAIWVLFAGTPATAATEIGTTVKVVNEVRARTLNRALRTGDRLVYQERVNTGRDSAINIRLIDESTLYIGARSELVLDSLVYNPNRGVVEGAIEVLAGIFRFSTSGVKMNVNITTPLGTIGVRGTQFDVLTEPAAMEVAVYTGTVEVTSQAGTDSVTSGQVYRVTAGGGAAFPGDLSPKMKQAVSQMLALLSEQGSGGAEAKSAPNSKAAPAGEQARVSPSAQTPLARAVRGKDPENLLYMGLKTGPVVIELRPDLAPKHVARFKELARKGFYDGLGFHFVRRGYVAEAGDPTGTGSGGSGQTIKAEFSEIPFGRGVVGMSRNRNDPDSADSQFFITLGRARHLDGKYTVIGRVIHGLDLVDRLQAGRPPKNPDEITTLKVGADIKN